MKKEIEETVERIIQNDILLCQSSLVTELLSREVFQYEDIERDENTSYRLVNEFGKEGDYDEDERETLRSRVAELEAEVERNCDRREDKYDEIQKNRIRWADRIAELTREGVPFSELRLMLHGLGVLVAREKVAEQSWRDAQKESDRLAAVRDAIEESECENDRDMDDIYEWWVVSSWLQRKLKAEGEFILDNDYGAWWGRTTSGQAISMDYVIQRIAEKLHSSSFAEGE